MPCWAAASISITPNPTEISEPKSKPTAAWSLSFPGAHLPTQASFLVEIALSAAFQKADPVIQSTERSGALITVKHAIDQNRDVFAVPGSIFSGSQGPIRVLQNGGFPVIHPDDILEHYTLQTKIPFPQTVATDDDMEFYLELRPIWDLLDAAPISGDDLVGALRWELPTFKLHC